MAFTKLYLLTRAAPYSPATFRGDWNNTASAVTKALGIAAVDGDVWTSLAVAETDTTGDWDVLLYRGVSGPLAAQTISGTVNGEFAVYTSNVAANLHYHLHIYVTQGDSDTPRGTLLTDYTEALGVNEWNTPLGSTATELNAAQTLSSLAISDGDRIVVELGYVARNTSATSYSGGIRYGTADDRDALAMGDLVTTDSIYTDLPGAPYIVFSNSISELTQTDRVTQVGAELVTTETGLTHATQVGVELIDAQTGQTNVTQVGVEVITESIAGLVVTQLPVETLQAGASGLTVTQLPVESLQTGASGLATTQLVVEILYSPYIYVPGETWTPLSTVYPPEVWQSEFPQDITGGTVGPDSQVYPPTVSQGVTTAFLDSGSQVYPPSLLATYEIGLPTVGPDSQVYPPEVTQGILGPYLPPGSIVYPPSVQPGPVEVGGAYIPPGSQVYPPSVFPVQYIGLPTIPPGSVVYPPEIQRWEFALVSAVSLEATMVPTTSGTSRITETIVEAAEGKTGTDRLTQTLLEAVEQRVAVSRYTQCLIEVVTRPSTIGAATVVTQVIIEWWGSGDLAVPPTGYTWENQGGGIVFGGPETPDIDWDSATPPSPTIFGCPCPDVETAPVTTIECVPTSIICLCLNDDATVSEETPVTGSLPFTQDTPTAIIPSGAQVFPPAVIHVSDTVETTPVSAAPVLYEPTLAAVLALPLRGSTASVGAPGVVGGLLIVEPPALASGALLLPASVAHAGVGISGVSGTLTQDSTVVLTGSGFGTRGDYGTGDLLCTGFSDLNAVGLSGETTDIEWMISADPNYADQWTAPSANARVAGKNYLERVNTDYDNYEGGGDIGVTMSGSTGTFFISWWMNVAANGVQQGGKPFRIFGDHDNLYSAFGGDWGNVLHSYAENINEGASNATLLAGSTWYRIDLQLRDNPDWASQYVNGERWWRRSTSLPPGDEDDQMVWNPWDGDGHTLGIGGYLDAGWRGYGTDGWYRFDDLYVDYTWARVELSDASTWSEATASHREIQLPMAWADGEITLRFNRGSLPAGTAYLYVVGTDGVPITAAGYAVTLP